MPLADVTVVLQAEQPADQQRVVNVVEDLTQILDPQFAKFYLNITNI